MANVAKDLAQLISQSKHTKTGPYDTQATVKRVEGNKVWVSIPGGIDETPIDKTVNCSAGDKVQVRVSGGRAWITGNASAPPTDDKTANEAKGVAVIAQTTAVDAKETADAVEGIAQAAQQSANTAATAAAQAVYDAGQASAAATAAQNSANAAQSSADNASEYAARALGNLSTVQSVSETLTWITQHGTMTLTTDVALDPTHVYFVIDPAGDYDVGGTYYSVVTEPDVADIGTYYELSIDESLNNYVGTHLALDTEGLWLLPASSGTNKVLIATGAGSTYTTAGTYLVDSGGTTVASFRANGATIGENASGKSRSEIGTSGMQIIQNVSGVDTDIANLGYGQGYDAGGQLVDAPFYTFGYRILPVGNLSVVEGRMNTASGFASHAEGASTTASGVASHAEGESTTASAAHGHAEGYNTTASGGAYGYSHAEGFKSIASGEAAHAQNYWTKASSDHQTALGKYNIEDNADTYAVIVGNGTADNARSDALTVDWSGNVVAAGDIEDGSGNTLSDAVFEDANGDVSITRNISAGGTITTGGHSSAIGDRQERNNSTTKSSSTSWTTVSTATVYADITAGTWLIQGTAVYESNSTGFRGLRLYNNTTSSVYARSEDVRAAVSVSGQTTSVHSLITVTATGANTIVLQTFQNSGGTRSVDYWIEVIRIA